MLQDNQRADFMASIDKLNDVLQEGYLMVQLFLLQNSPKIPLWFKN